jgi:GNAT superfamily N-acetyltransferase
MTEPSKYGRASAPALSLPISLRDAVRPSDREAVRSIIESTGFFRPDEVAIAVELVDERLSRGPESGYHFVFADSEDALAGYACYGPIACTIASYDLYWIAVDPRFQRHGVGRQLIAAVESRIAEAGGKRIYIDTSGRPQYKPTRAFYERSGFRCDACLPDFYGPGDNRAIYVRILG